MKDYTNDELKKLTSDDIEKIRKETESELTCLNLTIQSKLQKFHGLARTLKGHGTDYLAFQRESYDLYNEIKELRKSSGEFMVKFVLLKRRWENIHGLNIVKEYTQLENGRMVLV